MQARLNEYDTERFEAVKPAALGLVDPLAATGLARRGPMISRCPCDPAHTAPGQIRVAPELDAERDVGPDVTGGGVDVVVDEPTCHQGKLPALTPLSTRGLAAEPR